MKTLILPGLLFLFTACQSGTDVNPASLTDAIVGRYQTNQYLDYTRLTLSTDQMPVVVIQSAADHALTLIIATPASTANVRAIAGVTLVRQDDQRTNLVRNGQVIGSVQAGRVFTASGMETQGHLLRLADSTLAFIGYRP